jgi:hypothetical protein
LVLNDGEGEFVIMSLLPPAYAALEPFAVDWALATTAERAAKRGISTEAERQALYAAVMPVAAQALSELDGKPLASLDAREKRLLDLLLSFSHVSLAVELQRDDEPQHAVFRQRMRLTASPADKAA